MKLLIERNANVYAIGQNGKNILHLLIDLIQTDDTSHNNFLQFVNYLFLLPTINTTTLLTQQTLEHLETPLLLAARRCSFPIIQQFIKSKGDIHDINRSKRSILHHAANNPIPSIISDLLHHYPQFIQQQLNQHDHIGFTPFHIAIRSKKTNSIQIQKHGNDISIFNIGKNDTDSLNSNTNDEFNFYNENITTLIQYDPTLLLQKTTSNATILHIAIKTQVELHTRLAGLIESIIDLIL